MIERDTLHDLFEKYEDESHKFERIENPPCKRKDLCGMILLDKLCPGTSDMVCSAEHDQVWFDADIDKFCEVASEDDVIYLLRCGIWYDDDVESLTMFV